MIILEYHVLYRDRKYHDSWTITVISQTAHRYNSNFKCYTFYYLCSKINRCYNCYLRCRYLLPVLHLFQAAKYQLVYLFYIHVTTMCSEVLQNIIVCINQTNRMYIDVSHCINICLLKLFICRMFFERLYRSYKLAN